MTGPSEHVDVDDLARLIETLQGVIKHHDKAIGSFEYRTRMLLVVPLLNALGWDTTNPAMVIPDYRVGNGKIDYALLGSGQGIRGRKPIVFIKVKPLGDDIVDADRSEALINAKMAGVNYVGLTNGDRWEFYDVFNQSLIVDQRILNISIRYHGAFICARELRDAFLRLIELTAGSIVEDARRRTRTYYDELNVEPSASSVEIRKAYLRKVKEVHPDLSKRSQANQETARLNQIYGILSNEQLRREYDAIIFSRNPGGVGRMPQRRRRHAETAGNTNDEERRAQSNRSSHGRGSARPGRSASRPRRGSTQSASGPSRPRSRARGWRTRRGPGFWRKARRLATALLVIAALVTVAIVGYHAYTGAPIGAAVDMMTEDYRVAVTCPTDPGTVLDFVNRPPYPDDRSNMSARHSEGWVAQVCNRDLVYDQSTDVAETEHTAQTAGPVVTEAPAPDVQPTATPGIQPTVEAPVRRSAATPPSNGERSVTPTAITPAPSLTALLAATATVTATQRAAKTVTHTPTPGISLAPLPSPIPTPVITPTRRLTPTATPGVTLKLPPLPSVTLPATIAPVATVALLPTLAPVPTVALLPTIAPAPTIALPTTVAPVPTVALPPTIAPSPTATNTPTPTPIPTNTPPPTPVPPPPLRHIEEKQFMLELINEERVSAGLDPVVLGDNAAAQLHAEASLENCFSSHWGIDGLKPYMRYSLAGGYQSNAENISGLDYCIKASDGYRANGSAKQEIRQAVEGLMGSPGHRDNILRPWHKSLNIGLAWDRYNFKVIQHFEGDYVEYDQLPDIERGVLALAGTVKNGVRFNDDFRDISVQVYYDRPPRTLTRGQVARTYCYDNGLLVAALRPPLTTRSYYSRHKFTRTYRTVPRSLRCSSRLARSALSERGTSILGGSLPWISGTAAGDDHSAVDHRAGMDGQG